MALTLTGAAVRALNDEELKSAKDTLVARAASAGRTSPEKLSSQLVVAAGEWVPAYQLTIQGFMEVRSPRIESVTRPFKEGMVLSAAPQPVKEPFDVWSVPLVHGPDAIARKEIVPIPSTLEKKDCQVCLGKGAAPCKLCFSKGTVNCEICMGSGSQPCSICKGLGKISCPDCEGAGQVKSGGMTNKILGPCGSCNGMGKFNCNHCAGGKVDCPSCGNAGKRDCPSCHGKGRMECAVCGGSSKVVTGMGFQVEFRPQQTQMSLLAVPGPAPAQDLALSQRPAPSSFEFPSEEAFRKDLAEAKVPQSFREAADQLLKRVKPPNSAAHLSSLKVSVVQGGAWRVTGAFAGHEFIYWIHPSYKTVFAENDPIGDVSRKSVEVAQAALARGDWESALDAARDSLALNPRDGEALSILDKWRRKLRRESTLLGIAAGALGGGIMALPIFMAEKGLNRAGPAILTGAAALLAGVGAAFLLMPLARRMFPTKKRLMTTGGTCAGAVFLFFILTKGVFGWDPVRNADQKDLVSEMGAKFKHGMDALYSEADLKVLETLYEKYKNSRADLTELNNYLQAQVSLKNDFLKLTKEFKGKLNETLYSDMFLTEKRAKIVEIREYYALRNVDVTPADEALKKIDDQIGRAAVNPTRRRSHSTEGRISITPIRRVAPRKAAAIRRAAPPPPPKKAAIKGKPSPARKAVPAKKKIKPNQEPEPKTKKKKPAAGRSTVN